MLGQTAKHGWPQVNVLMLLIAVTFNIVSRRSDVRGASVCDLVVSSMYLYMSVYACRVCPNSFLHFGRIWVGRQQAGPKFHVLRLVIIFLFSKTWWDRILEEGRSSKVPLRFHAFSLTNLQNQHQIDISQLRHEVVSVLVAAYVINWNLGEKKIAWGCWQWENATSQWWPRWPQIYRYIHIFLSMDIHTSSDFCPY